MRCRSTSLHEVPPGTGNIDCSDFGFEELRCEIVGDAPADFLDDDRRTETGADRGDPRQQSREARVAGREQRLLQGVQMQHQRVCAQRVEEVSALVNANAEIQLHRTEIGEQRHVGRELAHIECGEHVGLLEEDTARAEAHGEFGAPARHGLAVR